MSAEEARRALATLPSRCADCGDLTTTLSVFDGLALPEATRGAWCPACLAGARRLAVLLGEEVTA